MRALLVALAAAAALWVLLVAGLIVAGRRLAARELAAFVPNVIVLLRGLLRDPRVPRSSKWLLALALAWLASPIDLIPEFVPVLGPLDDAVVVALVLRRVLRTAGPEVLKEHWRGDERTLARLLRLAGSPGGGLRGSPD